MTTAAPVPRPAWHAVAAAVGGYLLLALLFFWQPLLGGYHVPDGGGDLLAFYWPYLRFAADSFQQDVFPWWNPYLNSGTPFAADVQSALYYPLNWPLFYYGRPLTFEWLQAAVILHYPLAGFFTWTLGRRLGMNWWGAFAAGAVYAFGGAMVARLGHSTALAAATWLPLLLVCMHGSLVAARDPFGWRSLRWPAGGGIVFAIILFAGHTQIALYCACVAGLLWLWWLGAGAIAARSAGRSVRPSLASLVSLPLTFAFGLAIAAIQIVPLAELLGLSIRADLTFARATEFAVPPLSLIQFVVPHFFGTAGNDYWGITGSLTEGYGYVGIAALVFAALGLALQRRNRMAWFFAVLAALGILLSLGQETALYGWLYRFVPGFGQVRAPGRLLLLADLGLAMLAGYGVAGLASAVTLRLRPWRRLVLTGADALLLILVAVGIPALAFALITSQGADPAIFGRVRDAFSSVVLSSLFLAAAIGVLLAWRRWPRARLGLLPALAAAILILDVMSANIGFNPGAGPVGGSFEHERVVAYLREQPGPARIDAFTDVSDVWAPNLPLVERIDDAGGSPINPLLLRRYQTYWANLGSRSVPGYELLNVDYIVGSKLVQLDWSRFQPALTDAPKVNLHRHQRSQPRAFVVPSARAADDDAVLARLKDTAWNPRNEVLLRPRAGLDPSATQVEPVKATLTVSHPDTNTTVVRGTSGGGWLVLNEVAYPGWRATVNGQAVPIETANYLMQAVPLRSGAFEAVFRFEPRNWWPAVATTAVALVAAAICIILGARQAGADRDQAPSAASGK